MDTRPLAKTRKWRVWIPALVASVAPGTGHGVTWQYVPSISAGIIYESNPDYFAEDNLEDDGYGGIVDGTLVISAETERAALNLRPRIYASAYGGSDNSDDLGTQDYYLPIDGYWGTQRIQYSVSTGYNQISTRNSEIFETDPNESPQTGTSGHVVSIDEDQQRFYFSPAIEYAAGQRDQVHVALDVQDVRYTEARRTGRSNYVYGDTRVTWTHVLGLKGHLTGSFGVDFFNAEAPDQPAILNGALTTVTVENSTVSYSLNAGYEHSLSDLTSVGVTGGGSHSDVTVKGVAPPRIPTPCYDPVRDIFVFCTFKTTENNFVGRLFLRQQAAETITTEFSLERSLQPNSDGAQVTQDAAQVYVSKQFATNFTGTLGLAYISQKAVGADSVGDLAERAARFDRDYVRADMGINWRLTPIWSVDAHYAYSEDRQDTTGSVQQQLETENHTVTLQLRYQGLGSR